MAVSAHALMMTGTVLIRDLSQPIITVNISESGRRMEESDDYKPVYIV
jgi:hypothetical protein